MSDPTDKPAKSRSSHRLRRGHKAEAEAAAAEAAKHQPKKRVVKTARQLDGEAFKQVDAMLASFAQRRFGALIPEVAKGFFGNATPEESKAPELQQAFALFFAYGFRDSQGRRIVDMFGQFGLELDHEQKRVLDAVLRCRFVVFVLDRKEDSNKQMQGRDLLRGEPLTLLDHNAYAQTAPGDVLIAYMFPVGDMWRPLGLATKIARPRTAALRSALDKLAGEQGFTPMTLADRRPAQVFWLGYRVADLNIRAKV
ncbi:hypothetical protein ACNOYE_08040 [Nannocystaceae bacterium ST9]